MHEIVITWDRHELHEAVCGALGIDSGWGSQRAVVEALGVGESWYSDVLIGRKCEPGRVLRLCAYVGLIAHSTPAGGGGGARLTFEVPSHDSYDLAFDAARETR